MNDDIEIESIKTFLNKQYGNDIGSKLRTNEIVAFRTLFFKLAIENTLLSLSEIGKAVNRDHATVIHARKNLFEELMTKTKYRDLYFVYTNVVLDKRTTDEDDVILRLKKLTKESNENYYTIKELEKKVNVLKNSTKQELTLNEIRYRKLTPKQQETYNMRVDLILKSFEWQKPKNEYEIITCADG